jgi:hypothetical protein
VEGPCHAAFGWTGAKAQFLEIQPGTDPQRTAEALNYFLYPSEFIAILVWFERNRKHLLMFFKLGPVCSSSADSLTGEPLPGLRRSDP